jgi:hypothetical protein
MAANYGQRAKSTIGGGPDSKMRMRIRWHQGNPYGKKGLAGSAHSFLLEKTRLRSREAFSSKKMRSQYFSFVLRGSGATQLLVARPARNGQRVH